MDFDLAHRAVPVPAALLLLLTSACTGENAAPAPVAPTQPPVVVLIQAPAATSTTTASIAEPTSEPARATVAPDARPLRLGGLARWRPAVENYAPSVQLANTTALNGARSPFATYLVAMHNRIHPIFADEYLGTLGNLPKDHPLNQDLTAALEIVLNRDTGKVVRMGVVRPSGMTEFDLVALSAVDRASPFGRAPDVIASPDGNVYVHWEFHRDPVDACTTRNAWPFILKSAP